MSDYGFRRVAACNINVHLGNPKKNAEEILKVIANLDKSRVAVAVFPELCLTGYSCGDLFLRKSLQDEVDSALDILLYNIQNTKMLICVGAPLAIEGKLYNCAVWLQGDHILGVIPKTYIPNYNEFYEKRWFTSGLNRTCDSFELIDKAVPFNENLIIKDKYSDLKIGTEICEDLWVAAAPSENLCKAGANLIVNLSASTELVGKSEYRRDLVRLQSAKCMCAYVYTSSGYGESTTDVIFSGHSLIADNGKIIAEGKNESFIQGEVDIDKCNRDRIKFNSDAWDNRNIKTMTVTTFIKQSNIVSVLPEKVDKYPFVPNNATDLTERCNEILDLQKIGLSQRLQHIGVEHVVLGLSGGLDSTLALIVCLKAFEQLHITSKNIHCISMPCFGTTALTKSIAGRLAEACNVSFEEINIKDACEQHLKTIGHSLTEHDIAYENAQARERTQILFDKANMLNGLVIGTGDMSELALGWCTYNGDHMSNYAVNVGVPKTLVKFIVSTYATEDETEFSHILREVCELPISPELLPPDENGKIAQKTEDSIGKYALHDFFLYHFLRNGFSKDKIEALAEIAFKDEIEPLEISETLNIFLTRFRTQQFKRSCIPDGVKIGSVALSPRGDLRMPSDLSVLY